MGTFTEDVKEPPKEEEEGGPSQGGGPQPLGQWQLDRWEQNQERGVPEAGRECFTEEGSVGVSKATEGQAGCGLRIGPLDWGPSSRVVWGARLKA